jgi:predicted PurR-regulated permease PerM
VDRQLELNPFAVFLAIAFCAWCWGRSAPFLAVPLLMAALADEKPDPSE